ncbi:MAG: hypothetical protein FWH48_07275 [Oscillospiraceae bacterium]|nr:hypothetical protein [Oscillospiraceae bacterium]
MTKTNAFVKFFKDTSGDAAVEAAVLFPICMLIFFALVAAALYLPARASLQGSTLCAANALSLEKSDTWLFFDEGSMEYHRAEDRGELGDVYSELIKSLCGDDMADRAETIVKNAQQDGIFANFGELSVECGIVNHVLYKEIIVTAVRTVPILVDLSLVGFPREIVVTASSTAVVPNGAEFVRNMDLAASFPEYMLDKFGAFDMEEAIGTLGNEFAGYFEWN